MKLTKRKFSIIILALALLISLTALFGLNSFSASAEGTATVSNVFTATGDGISIVGDEQQVADESGTTGTATKYFMTFLFNKTESEDEGFVYYKNRLAYNWFEKGENEEATDRHLNFEIGFKTGKNGFDTVGFERFVITFETQQYNKTKDGKTSNYIMFFPADNGVYALITQDKDATVEDIVGDKKVLPVDHIVISLAPISSGDYAVQITGGSTGVTGTFKNIGGNYARAVTSGNKLVYPLIFSSEFPESADKAKTAMILYNLNGQRLASSSGTINASNGFSSITTVDDDKPPVLCLEEDVNFFTVGGELDFDFVAIDVLRTSPSTKVYYYLLTNEQRKGEDKEYDKKELFAEADDDTRLETNHDKYLPTEADLAGKPFDHYESDSKNFRADMLVKIYVNLVDYSSRKEETDVFLDWYVPQDYRVNIDGTDFIAVAEDKLGVRYNDADAQNWENIKIDYQKAVDEAAKNLSAGTSSYFYLPSAESLFTDNATVYEDLKLSVYYYHTSQESSTNLTSDNLSISIPTQGTYVFTIYATDASGNNMYYIDKEDKVKEFAASEVWTMFKDNGEDGLYHKLPWFTFNVSYKGVEFEEDPGMQSTAYVGTMYSSASFKINGISGAYDTTYKLYYFDRDAFYKETGGVSYSYEEFISVMDDLFDNSAFTGDKSNTRKFFTEILSAADMEETDEDYETYSEYSWTKSSTSFNPQKAGYYYMVAEVKDTLYNAEPVRCSLAVVASETAKTIKGEPEWLKNNIASVVLLSVAGLSLIGIILLLVIKPKDKTDIDVKYAREKSRSKKNK